MSTFFKKNIFLLKKLLIPCGEKPARIEEMTRKEEKVPDELGFSP